MTIYPDNDYEIEVRDYEMCCHLTSLSHHRKNIEIQTVRYFLLSFDINLCRNDMTHRIEINGLPERYQGEEEFDSLCTITTDILSKMGFKKLSSINNIFKLIARENRYHPVLKRIISEEWDGIDRLSEIYSILGLDDDLSKILVKKWAIQAIAMLYNDLNNPFAAQGVLVLQGSQGAGKTEFFRHLAIDNNYFKEGAVVDVSNKDTRIATTSCWICEIGELDSTTGKKQASLKSFLTSAIDEYRVPYDRNPVRRPRRTSFCGTVNPNGFLTDETGNRRFWTVAVNRIDKKKVFGYSPEWYTQFWRQILCDYIANPKAYLLTPEESDLLSKRNEYHENDVLGEDEFLSEFNISAPKSSWSKRTAADVSNILNEEYPRLNMNASKLGKTLLPKLERRFNVCFDKKHVGGKQYRLFPPRFCNPLSDSDSGDFAESYRISLFGKQNDLPHNEPVYIDPVNDDDDIVF